MKFTFLGYSQKKLIENEIDLRGAAVLRLIADLHTNILKKKKYIIYNGRFYIWFTYGYLIQEFPLLGSEKTVIRKINELVEKGFLHKIIKTNKNGMAGTYMYVTLTDKYEELNPYNSKNYLDVSHNF